jgi:hypothetical protein
VDPEPSRSAPLPAGGTFTAGALLLQVLRVWWRGALAFSAVGALLEVPLYALNLRIGKGPGGASPALLLLFLWVVNVVAVAALSQGALEALAGRRPRVGAMLAMVSSRLWPVFAVSAVLWSLVLIAAFPGIPLLLPGVFVLVVGFVCVPAVIAEPGLGTVAALQRSLQLTQGHRLALFWALLVVCGLYGGILSGTAALLDRLPALPFPVSVSITSAVDAVLTGISGTCAAVAYHQLRALAPRAEGGPAGF